jgi:uncharacterized protein DUF3263
MQHVIERNENITEQRARGTAWTVRDLDGIKIGTISHGERGWTVFSAGWGVKVDHNEVHRCRDTAIAAVLAAREVASQPGGALAVDSSGLTGHQRAAIDMMRSYAMSNSARRDAVIWEQFDMTPTQFFTEWNALIDNPLALAYAPTVINRHQRLRAARKARRTRTAVPV